MAQTHPSQLDALVSFITSSVATVQEEYKAAGLPAPSLDVLKSGDHGSLGLDLKLKIEKEVMVIEAACAQLCATVARPEHTLVNMAMKHWLSSCLNVALSANVAGLLLDKPGGLPIKELSSSTGIDADRLAHVLRFLSTNHVFEEVSINVFANNAVSASLATSTAAKDSVLVLSRESLKSSACLGDFLLPSANAQTASSPFEIAYGASAWELRKKPEMEGLMKDLAASVEGWGEITGRENITKAFPWGEWFSSSEITICDIGAGKGDIMLLLKRAYSQYNFKIVIQELPPMLTLAKQIWDREDKEAVQKGIVNFVPVDFLNEAPVEGCEIYYLRHCIHNWPDEQCKMILSNIAKAMLKKKESVLLIHETILRPASTPAADVGSSGAQLSDIAPKPLLPNFGAGRFREYAADMNMMSLVGAKERMLEEILEICISAGFALQRVWDAGETSIVELKLA